MARKIATASALLVFAVSILLGMAAENTFTTTVSRALQGMAITFVVGMVIGAMAERMVQENLSRTSGKNKNSEVKPPPESR